MEINSENITASELITLSNNEDVVDVTEVLKISGTHSDFINIINSDNIIGFNTVDLVVTDVIDSDKLSVLQENTTGTIEQAGE
tara:strand:+ start:488 stop:736 length:249 start_codon:yes stop_codon:yes gene_type:complete